MEESLKEIFRKIYEGEAKAVLRLRAFARIAQDEGLPQIAHLFRAVAASEEIHGIRALRRLGLLKDTEANLKASFESESEVAGKAYAEFLKMATELGDEGAVKIFSQSRDVEDTHAELYKRALSHFMEERETTYYVCKVCGYVSDGTLPDTCPVCGAKSAQFESL
ncbi:MAG: rubrerythrin family protein [Deltaproteobacteria bacterium]|nr:MAG: rubrerythrin family protein [Deltaproteobacteria bacterium]